MQTRCKFVCVVFCVSLQLWVFHSLCRFFHSMSQTNVQFAYLDHRWHEFSNISMVFLNVFLPEINPEIFMLLPNSVKDEEYLKCQKKCLFLLLLYHILITSCNIVFGHYILSVVCEYVSNISTSISYHKPFSVHVS